VEEVEITPEEKGEDGQFKCTKCSYTTLVEKVYRLHVKVMSYLLLIVLNLRF
jgi:hypothetical protein